MKENRFVATFDEKKTENPTTIVEKIERLQEWKKKLGKKRENERKIGNIKKWLFFGTKGNKSAFFFIK